MNSVLLNTSDEQKHSRDYPEFRVKIAPCRPAATDSRDENLKAKVPGDGERVKVEARGNGAHNLDATAAAIPSKEVSSHCPGLENFLIFTRTDDFCGVISGETKLARR